MKVVLLTDSHHGGKTDAIYFQKYISKFYDEVFFPYLEENNISTIIHLGDLFDRRKYINFVSLKNFYESFYNKLKDYDVHFITGNHDVFYRNTNSVNSMELLLDSDVHKIYSKPATVELDGVNIDLIPWLCSEDEDETKLFIENSKSEILLGHLEIDGFAMYKGIPSMGGLNPDMFKRFDLVCSGHYHHKSTKGNINYLGSPYQITWHDDNDARGFHVLDTATRTLEFRRNPNELFKKIFYNDSNKVDIDKIDYSDLDKKIIKVIVVQKNDPVLFDKVITKIEAQDIHDLKIEEDYTDFLNSYSGEDVHIEDTFQVLNNYVENLECNDNDKKILKNKLNDIYMEAMTL